MVPLSDGAEVPGLTGHNWFSVWTVEPYVLTAVLVVTGLYVLGWRRLAANGHHWPVGRACAFVAAMLALAVATMSAMGAYDDTLFSAHMSQHMVISMVAPVFLALAAPVTLLLRNAPRSIRRLVLAVLHSAPVRLLTHPLPATALFVGSLYALYFTGIYELTLRHEALHELQHLHFLIVGCLFFFPLLSVDPLPRRPPHPARLGLVAVMLPLHAWLGIALMMSSTAIAADYYLTVPHHAADLLADQHLGGAILWAFGDLISLLYVAVMAVQWMRADDRLSRRHDRRVTAAGGRDDELAAYNAYLRRLNAQGDTAARSSATSTGH